MDNERLEDMGTEQLMESFSDWLDQTGETEFDPSVMDGYLELLAGRDPVSSSFDPAAAEQDFRARHQDLFPAKPPLALVEKKHRFRRLAARVSAVAAVAVLSTALVAHSMGVDLFGSIARWSKGQFLFSTGQGASGKEGYAGNIWNDDTFYSHGQAALDAYGVEVPMMPMWNPPFEDDEIPGLEISVTKEEDGTVLFIEDHRTRDGRGYTFEVRQHKREKEALTRLEGVDNPETVVYEYDGRTYYILPTGEDTYTITWAVGRYSGKIYGNMDLERAEHFARSVTQRDEFPYEPPDMSVPPEHSTIQEALEDAGIETEYAPTWIPEGFVPVESNVFVNEETFRSAYLFCTDVEGERNLSISIDMFTNPDSAGSMVFEKDDNPVVEYKRGGITFYIMTNLDWRTVAWTDGSVLGSIGGGLTQEECQRMIDSIPRYTR